MNRDPFQRDSFSPLAILALPLLLLIGIWKALRWVWDEIAWRWTMRGSFWRRYRQR